MLSLSFALIHTSSVLWFKQIHAAKSRWHDMHEAINKAQTGWYLNCLVVTVFCDR